MWLRFAPMPGDCHVLLERGGLAERLPPAATELRLFSKCRNERLRLPAFLAHYRRLGVKRFFIVDNASTDGTTEYLEQQSDVHVFWTDGAFRGARGGTDWLNALLSRFGVGGWCVTVDIDELLRFPGSESTGLATLVRYLDERGAQAMACLLLDMYPGGSMGDSLYEAGDDLLSAAPYFDAAPYRRFPFDQCPGHIIYGGVRERVFYPESYDEDLKRKLHVKLYHRVLFSVPVLKELKPVLARRPVFPPCLTKVPLVRWDAQTKYLNVNHFVSERQVADVTGVLLHFKLLQDFHARAVQEMQRGQYYDGATEFVRYVAKLRDNPNLSLTCERSVRFENDEQLERLGLMQDSRAWSEARARGVSSS
jgi:hypothetical protein